MFEIDKKKFGHFVAQLRKEKGMTQKELAQQLFISDKAISKWETGVSIPDTTLLIPLSDLLGVTVTELLMCEKIQHSNVMDSEQVENIVKTAIKYSDEDHTRAYNIKNYWSIIYILSALFGCIGIYLNYINGYITEALITYVMFGAGFGAYFCFFVKLKLPKYYDENRINCFVDGAVRMNIPGLTFNNKNWSYIINTGRIWSCSTMLFIPYIFFIANKIVPISLFYILDYIILALVLCGLFIPMYIVGKKYE